MDTVDITEDEDYAILWQGYADDIACDVSVAYIGTEQKDIVALSVVYTDATGESEAIEVSTARHLFIRVIHDRQLVQWLCDKYLQAQLIKKRIASPHELTIH